MSVLTCLGCTARYSVGAAACPQCGGVDFVAGDAVAEPALMPDPGAAAAPADDDTSGAAVPVAQAEPKAKAAGKSTTT